MIERRRPQLLAAFVTAIVLVISAPAAADTYVVAKHGDPAPAASGPRCDQRGCSLREAILDANESLGEADTIVLPGRRRPYQLHLGNLTPSEDAGRRGDLDIANDPLRIVHRGKGRATIDANEIDRIFQVFAGAGLEVRRLDLTGGRADPDDAGGDGGAIQAQNARVEVVRSRLRRNRSGPFGSDGGAIQLRTSGPVGDGVKLVVGHSVLARNRAATGGAIATKGPGVRVRRSTITANRAVAGGGGGLLLASSDRRMSISGSTISANHAATGGGGVVASDSLAVGIENSTVSGNEADGTGGGALITDLSTTTIAFSTIAGNVSNADRDAAGMGGDAGGGLAAEKGTNTLVRASLFAHNRQLGGSEGRDCVGGFESLGHNLLQHYPAGGECAGFDRGTDLTGRRPRIGRLRRNGGPTKTHALHRRSPAIDHGGPRAPARDQRGTRRGRRPDTGAYERR